MGKKNLSLFQTLRKEKAVRAKAVGSVEVPNLQEPLVEVHVHGGSKRKVELPVRPDRGEECEGVSRFVRVRIFFWWEGTRGWTYRVARDCVPA